MDLVKFMHKQDTATQLRIARSTTLDFLQANDVEAVLAGQIEQKQAENVISKQEEEGQGDGSIRVHPVEDQEGGDHNRTTTEVVSILEDRI